MRILAVDTSAPATSIALWEDGVFAASLREEHRHPPSDAAFLYLQDLFNETGWSPADLDAFAVSVGPGSFTGLRVGLGMVKTFAWALSKPVFGYDAVEIAALRALDQVEPPSVDQPFVAVVLGLRGTHFSARYQVVEKGLMRSGDLHYDDDAAGLCARWGADSSFFLDQSAAKNETRKVSQPLSELLAPERLSLLGNAPSPAEALAAAAAKDLKSGETSDFDAVQPQYLKPFSVGRRAKKPGDLK
ncbi:MAG: tRNA (adenosine(37)-N6)-threonylcarbamoyltransferase complex dimerization subunit type 1 TsaB [Planctomycetota bacterium]